MAKEDNDDDYQNWQRGNEMLLAEWRSPPETIGMGRI
jgi:hypothetical protein